MLGIRALKIRKCVATKGLTGAFFGCVATKGVTGAFFVSVAGKELTSFPGVGESVGQYRKAKRTRRSKHKTNIS